MGVSKTRSFFSSAVEYSMLSGEGLGKLVIPISSAKLTIDEDN